MGCQSSSAINLVEKQQNINVTHTTLPHSAVCSSSTHPIDSLEQQTKQHVDESTERSVNLENHTLLWLDYDVNKSVSMGENKQQLRTIIDYVKTFEQPKACEDYVRDRTTEHIFLIVSGSLGKIIVPRIHSLSHLSAAYIYCRDRKTHQEWAAQYSKVRGIYVDFASLKEVLACDLSVSLKNDDTVPISIFSRDDQENTHSSLNGQFLCFQVIIDLLLRMENNDSAKKAMLHIYATYYEGNTKQMKFIDEFEQTYTATKAIWWYTKQSCFYYILNKALRVQNFEVIFKLRFFIKDIYLQLEDEYVKARNHSSPILTSYRGQAMHIDEIERLKKNIGEFMSINAFFSTSSNIKIARSFVGLVNPTDEIKRVLFVVKADRRLNDVKPFADVQHLSYFSDEQEVMFSMGSIFRIENVLFTQDDQIWTVKLSLCSEMDDDIREVSKYLKEKYSNGNHPVFDFGRVLMDMGHYDASKRTFEEFLNTLSSDDYNVASCYEGLGVLAYQKKNFDEAIDFITKAIDFFSNRTGDNRKYLTNSHAVLGAVYSSKHDKTNALISYQTALELQRQLCPPDDPAVDVAESYLNIANLYAENGDYDLALSQMLEALSILQRKLPKLHKSTAICLQNIGTVYYLKNDFDQALIYHLKAYEIYQRLLGPEHEELMDCLEGLACGYGALNQLDEAWIYLRKIASAANMTGNKIILDSLMRSCYTVGTAYENKKRWAESKAVYEYGVNEGDRNDGADRFYYIDCLNRLGVCYYENRNYDQALACYERCLEIDHKMFPQQYVRIATTHGNMGNTYSRKNDARSAARHFELALQIMIENNQQENVQIIEQLQTSLKKAQALI